MHSADSFVQRSNGAKALSVCGRNALVLFTAE